MRLPEPDDLDLSTVSPELQAEYNKMLHEVRNDPDTWTDSKFTDPDLQVVTPDYARNGSVSAPLTSVTSSVNVERPRTVRAGYDSKNFILTVQFRDLTVYNYYDVSPGEWIDFNLSASKNDYIKAVLDFKDHGQASISTRSQAVQNTLGKHAARYKKVTGGTGSSWTKAKGWKG